jgi:DNA-binding MarR family transcriptional regulator
MQRSEIIPRLIESFETTNRLMHRYFHDKFADSGVAPSQIKLLHVLQANQPTTSRQLSGKLYLTPGAVTQLVEPLVVAGYVSRTPDAHDRRSMCLNLTESGEIKLQEIKQSRKELFETIVTTLSTEELELLLNVQHKIVDTLEVKIENKVETSMQNKTQNKKSKTEMTKNV